MLSISDLKKSGDFLDVLLESMSSAVFIVKKDGPDITIQQYNDAFKELFKTPDMKIQNARYGNAMGCEHAVKERRPCGQTSKCSGCLLQHSLSKALTYKVPALKERWTRIFFIEGREIQKYLSYSAKSIRFGDEEMVMVVLDDITELMELKLESKQRAVTDELTRLYNHKNIYLKLDEEISRARRYKTGLSLMILDIDHFKAVNDAHGHHVGDRTLAAIGKQISDSLRDIDLAGRYEGEEFMVILPQTQLKAAWTTAERIRKKIEETTFDGVKHTVTISGGVAQFENEESLKFIDKAETLLYKAKEKGYNRIEKQFPEPQ